MSNDKSNNRNGKGNKKKTDKDIDLNVDMDLFKEKMAKAEHRMQEQLKNMDKNNDIVAHQAAVCSNGNSSGGDDRKKEENTKGKTLCLNMIVKNEEKIILDCLNSIVDYLDYWVIYDTGSTDNTPEVIKTFFAEKGVPGELHYAPWKNFSHNRNLVLNDARSKADYSILLDADFVANVKEKDFKKYLSSPGYLLRYEGGLEYRQTLLVSNKFKWQYIGVTHEYIETKPPQSVEITDCITITHSGLGSNRGDKYLRDVTLLTEALKEEPNNMRYWFYLGQSYKDWGKYDEAISAYKTRVAMSVPGTKDWNEEVYYSLYQIGICKRRRGDDFYDFVGDFLKAWNNRPTRIEPLFQIMDACAYDNKKLAPIVHQLCMLNTNFSVPIYDLLFIERPLYDYMYLDTLYGISFNAEKYKEAYDIVCKLLNNKDFPANQLPRLQKDKLAIEQKLQETGKSLMSVAPFKFKRISLNRKDHRIAIIIANYNMTERANSLVNSICSSSTWPADIILVDNGSDKVAPSMFTAVALAQNVQTTHAWYAGLNYADSLEIVEGFKYYAYAFVITSCELMSSASGVDPIEQLVSVLALNKDVVGVHPGLTLDSTTAWKHLFHQNPSKIRQTNMIDNIFSVYNAAWFNSIGRFERTMTYAWGIDLETSYLARKSGKKLCVNDHVLVRKISNIGYSMDRMNMSSNDRQINAQKQMDEYFAHKYGGGNNTEENIRKGNDVIWSETFEEAIQMDKLPDEKIVTAFLDMANNHQQNEAAHHLLIDTLYNGHHFYYNHKSPVKVLEIGMANDNERYPHLNSTEKLFLMCIVYGYEFTSIDMDPKIVMENRKYFNYEGHSNLKLICKRGEDYCANLTDYVDIVYLDAFDIISKDDDGYVCEHKNKRYKEILKQDITLQNCAKMHAECVRHLVSKINLGGLICISDPRQRGLTAVPFLLDNGFIQMLENSKGILLQKISNSSRRVSFDPVVTVKMMDGSEMIANDGMKNETDGVKNETDGVKNKNGDANDQKTVDLLGNILTTNLKVSLNDLKKEFMVVLLGYTQDFPRHTNWYPWDRFRDVFKTLKIEVAWVDLENMVKYQNSKKRRIFICWNDPTSVELIRSGFVRKNDIIFQKLTSIGKGMDDVNWGDDPYEWCKTWHWPIYQSVEKLYDMGFNIYAFGCKTISDPFPIKKRIVSKLEAAGRLFWIQWGTTMYDYAHLQNMRPAMDELNTDIAFVGSKWGVNGRGNTDQWDKFMQPLISKYPNNSLHGSGLGMMPENDIAHNILKLAKLCPIIHAPSWIAEQGVQDRFWTVFATGRFGVCDNPGVYEFFDKDEVVVETDPAKYIEKSIYFLENPEKQIPYIEKVQHKIKTKYNFYNRWNEILLDVFQKEYYKNYDDIKHLDRVTSLLDSNSSFL